MCFMFKYNLIKQDNYYHYSYIYFNLHTYLHTGTK